MTAATSVKLNHIADPGNNVSKFSDYFSGGTGPSHVGILESFGKLWVGNPSTTLKAIKCSAQAVTMWVDPNNETAKNLASEAGTAKDWVSALEAPLFLTRAAEGLGKTVTSIIYKDGKAVENGLGSAQNTCLGLGECTKAATLMAERGVYFDWTADQIEGANKGANLILGAGAVFGTTQSCMKFANAYEKFSDVNPKSETTAVGQELKANIKDIRGWEMASELMLLLKNITYIAFGVLAVIALVAPSLAVPQTLVWALTVATVVTTAAKHFIDVHVQNNKVYFHVPDSMKEQGQFIIEVSNPGGKATV